MDLSKKNEETREKRFFFSFRLQQEFHDGKTAATHYLLRIGFREREREKRDESMYKRECVNVSCTRAKLEKVIDQRNGVFVCCCTKQMAVSIVACIVRLEDTHRREENRQ
jgi:hypothetical protein